MFQVPGSEFQVAASKCRAIFLVFTSVLAWNLGLGTRNSFAADFTSAANATTGAEFLNLGVGARAAAMGGAFNAVADDSTALYWNPAAMTNIESNSISAMHAPYLAGTYFDYLSYAHNFGDYGAAGISYQYFSFSGVSATDNSGASLGSIYPYDLAATAGYAYRFEDSGPEFLQGYSLGLAVKMIRIQAVSIVEGAAADIGLLSRGYVNDRLRWALTVDNIGKPLSFDGDRENLPLAFNAGGSWRCSQPWLVSWNISAPRGGNPYFQAGTEYKFYQGDIWSFAVRAGYDSQTLQSITGLTGASFGFGVGLRGLSVDYAFSPLGALGQANRVSLSYKL